MSGSGDTLRVRFSVSDMPVGKGKDNGADEALYNDDEAFDDGVHDWGQGGDLAPEEKLRPGPDGQTRGMALLGPTLQPLFSQFVCHPAVVGIAQTILDSHVRIANSGSRNLSSDEHKPGDGRALWVK